MFIIVLLVVENEIVILSQVCSLKLLQTRS